MAGAVERGVGAAVMRTVGAGVGAGVVILRTADGAGPVEPTGGPALDLQRVLAVPNPYRGSEVWDRPGQSEVHFINLPTQARIRIYTLAGDLVRIRVVTVAAGLVRPWHIAFLPGGSDFLVTELPGELRLVRALTDQQIEAMRDPRLAAGVKLPTIEDAVKKAESLAQNA